MRRLQVFILFSLLIITPVFNFAQNESPEEFILLIQKSRAAFKTDTLAAIRFADEAILIARKNNLADLEYAVRLKAEYLVSLDSIAAAAENYKDALRLYKENNNTEELLETYNELALILFNSAKYKDAIRIFEEGITEANKKNNDLYAAKFKSGIALVNINQGNS